MLFSQLALKIKLYIFFFSGRGKKKKIKNPSMNVMIGASMTAALVIIVAFMSVITATVVKALLFSFFAKFLITVNWKGSSSSKNSSGSHKDLMVLMT